MQLINYLKDSDVHFFKMNLLLIFKLGLTKGAV